MSLDKYLPKLTPIELAEAITACKDAGAVSAAQALSKHIARLEVELEAAKLGHPIHECRRGDA